VLSHGELHQIADVFVELLQGLYAHLPQKRAMYGFDPIQKIRLLEQQIGVIDEAVFHRQLAVILTELRDAHTRYLGPTVETGGASVLPLLLESYRDDRELPHYVVSKVFKGDAEQARDFALAGFEPGVAVTHWNGVPVRRAVELHAEHETGGRPDARLARALESMTIRPHRYGLQPDAEWVNITFHTSRAKVSEVRVFWKDASVAEEPIAAELDGSGRHAYAGDPGLEVARRAKMLLFASSAWLAAQSATPTLASPWAARGGGARTKTARAQGDWHQGRFADNVRARTVQTDTGLFGHLRIYSFDLRDDQGFVEEVIELVRQLPKRGLIIDLRGNPGGLVWASERLLQLFTPRQIEPTRFSLLATDLTRTMAIAPQGEREFAPWRHSLEAALSTGDLHSRSLPLTPTSRCNDQGQQYSGPVVALVDGNTYSAGDLFAAGFVDNKIGPLVSVGAATGAGGANVWFPEHVEAALSGTHRNLRLPGGVRYTFAFRRAVRTGELAGTTLEDLGVEGHYKRSLTRNDLLHGNKDLLGFCGTLLASERFTDLHAVVDGDTLLVHSRGLDRLDVLVDGDHLPTLKLERAADAHDVQFDLPAGFQNLEVRGSASSILRQRRLLSAQG
jgi:hypothetical protein